MAERNSKPLGVQSSSSASSSPPETAPAPAGALPIAGGTSKISHPQMEQALWLSRATALLRAEEERRQQEHLVQMILSTSQVIIASGTALSHTYYISQIRKDLY